MSPEYSSTWLSKALACLCAGLIAASPQPAAGQYACGDGPSAYFDGDGGVFDDYYDSSGFPVFNKDHCYGNPIFSTNGKDTYTSNPYGNRRMTNSGYGYQCFELAQRYFLFKFGLGLYYMRASDLCHQSPRGSTRFRPGQRTPVPGDLFVFDKAQCGVSPTAGHVAVVTKVWNNQAVQVAQQNVSNEKRSIENVSTACACGFVHADSNMNVNGPFVATPANIRTPHGRYPGWFGPVDGGGNPTEDSDFCYCKSTDALSIWPLCCKKK